MWDRIKKLVLGKPSKECDKNVIFVGIEYTENVEIAEMFNEYFINSIREIRVSMENVHYSNHVQTSNYSFNFRAISLIT